MRAKLFQSLLYLLAMTLKSARTFCVMLHHTGWFIIMLCFEKFSFKQESITWPWYFFLHLSGIQTSELMRAGGGSTACSLPRHAMESLFINSWSVDTFGAILHCVCSGMYLFYCGLFWFMLYSCTFQHTSWLTSGVRGVVSTGPAGRNKGRTPG